MRNTNWADLEKLPTQQLDQMLQDEDADPETIKHILTVLQEREKDIPLTVTDAERQAWCRYKLREKEGMDKPTKKQNWVLRVASVAVVFLVLTVAIAHSVKAEGIWERIVRWTDSVIEFFSPDYAGGGRQAYEFQTDHPGLQQIYDTATKMGVTDPVVPMWLPEGYTLAFCERIDTDNKVTLMSVFRYGEKALNYNIAIYSEGVLNQYQKDETVEKMFEVQGIKHYIVRNIDKWVAVWTKENIECSISVDCQEDELYKTLRSIYYKEETS